MSERLYATGGVSQAVGREQLERLQARCEAAYTYAVKAQKHLWVATTAFLLSDRALELMAEEPLSLDLENMLMQPAVGCFVCEQPYEPRMRLRKCPGEPR